MNLLQKLEKPINGFWDGGQKDTFEWSIDGEAEDSKGSFCKIGSWGANHWFHVAKGKTEKLTLSYAMKHLRASAIKRGLICQFQYVV